MEAYRIKNLNFSYPRANRKALNDINLTIHKGEFITICGQSGSGKSTLIRHLKTVLTPYGEREGEIYYCGQPLIEVPHPMQVSHIGYVFQSPDNQIVTDKVWHELAFGLESLGCDNNTIRLRVAEIAGYFGIQKWFYKKVSELSEGEKQILSLAGIMTMQPDVLILDEPTSQLDPIAASDFIGTIKKINRELGITIIITEHRLEDIIPMSDRLIVMDEGRIIADDIPEKVGMELQSMGHPMFYAMTSPMQIYGGVDSILPCPVTINQGRRWIDAFMDGIRTKENYLKDIQDKSPQMIAIELKDIWFRHEKSSPDILKDFSIKVRSGELYCILGGNGTGKTTALSVIGGLMNPYRGKVSLRCKAGRIAMLPQNPQSIFIKNTVKEDLYEMFEDMKISDEEKSERMEKVIDIAELAGLLDMHPYDLSGGEQQRAALAKVLLNEPEILLLDEPTKGLDNYFKETFAEILKKLAATGVTIVMVSHDIEFCAKHGDTIALVFDGSIISSGNRRKFFAGNSFYTTAANRMIRHIYPEAVTVEEVIEVCKKEH